MNMQLQFMMTKKSQITSQEEGNYDENNESHKNEENIDQLYSLYLSELKKRSRNSLDMKKNWK